MVPDEGLGWFERHRPRRALLTNRHHLRGAPEFADAFGISIHCHPAGLHEFEGGPEVLPMEPGDTPAEGITVLELGALTPEEVVLQVDAGPGALAFADGLIRGADGSLGFFEDALLGDDPEAVKRDLHAALRRLLAEQEFDALLLAHGKPRASGGRAELGALRLADRREGAAGEQVRPQRVGALGAPAVDRDEVLAERLDVGERRARLAGARRTSTSVSAASRRRSRSRSCSFVPPSVLEHLHDAAVGLGAFAGHCPRNDTNARRSSVTLRTRCAAVAPT